MFIVVALKRYSQLQTYSLRSYIDYKKYVQTLYFNVSILFQSDKSDPAFTLSLYDCPFSYKTRLIMMSTTFPLNILELDQNSPMSISGRNYHLNISA